MQPVNDFRWKEFIQRWKEFTEKLIQDYDGDVDVGYTKRLEEKYSNLPFLS